MIPQDNRGLWIMEWHAYPRDLMATMLQAHRLPGGYEAAGLAKSDAYSLRVRLQKMQAGLRRQGPAVPNEVREAAEQVRWVVVPVSPTSWTLRGVAHEPAEPLRSTTLPSTLVGDAILARLLDTPTSPTGSAL